MKPKNHKALVLAALAVHPLTDSGGPVMVRIPEEQWEEERRKSKADTKAKELRRRTKNQAWYGPAFNARPTLLHLVKLGLVTRERSHCGRSNRTHFKLVEKEVTAAELFKQSAALFVAFVDSMKPGSLAHICCDIGTLNKALLTYGEAVSKDET